MTRERWTWVAAVAVLATAALIQTVRLEASRAEANEWRDKASWPDRASPAEVEPLRAGAFNPSVQASIPKEFWGEFAEDVHDCGAETSLIISAEKIAEGEEMSRIKRVEWPAAKRLKIEAIGAGGYDAAFAMEMSHDNAEITFVYSNRKRVVQRCSERAHAEPEPLKSVSDDTATANTMNVDDFVDIDANMTVEPDWSGE